MVKIADFNNMTSTAHLLDEGFITLEHRPYLGMSQLGHSCPRYLWYSFHWCFEDVVTPRTMRIFARGHREEPYIIDDLLRIGITISGDQDEVECCWGHCKGHRDGVAEGVPEAPKTPHLAEFKTMGNTYFKDIQKKGLKESKPVYYAQCQIYMRKFKLTRTLFVAINKNDSAYYVERIPLDKGFADDLERKAETIIIAQEPLKKPFSKTWYECKWCSAKHICHNNGKWLENCRTCKYGEPAQEAAWICTKYDDSVIPEAFQRVGCDKYESRQ
jgi:hypothetical protein